MINCVYYQQAVKNESFLSELEHHLPQDFYDWKTTIIFYTALHYLKSFGTVLGVNFETHVDASAALKAKGVGLPPDIDLGPHVWKYAALYGHSRSSRYAGYVDSNYGKLAKSRLKDDKRYLADIKDWIVPRLEAHYNSSS